jgi:inorganic pyrophosphatase
MKPTKRPRSNRDFLHLPVGTAPPEQLNVVVEIPSGGRNKIEFDKKLHVFRLDRVLHSPTYYPGDHGFIPQTLASDGDPLDVLVLVSEPTFAGCLIAARPIGMLRMVDEAIPDEKILAVPLGEPEFATIVDYRDISPHVLVKIAQFFETYKQLEGKHTRSDGWANVEAAKTTIVNAISRFADQQS